MRGSASLGLAEGSVGCICAFSREEIGSYRSVWSSPDWALNESLVFHPTSL